MKNSLLIALLSVFVLSAPAFALVTSKTFSIQANIPAATGSNIDAFSVQGTPPVFTAVPGTVLSFNTGTSMPYNSTLGIYIPTHFYAINVSGTGGAGAPDVTVSYTGDTKPVGQTNGLGVKATATFMKVVGTTETALTTHGPKKRLIDVSESIAKAELGGGALRIYLGVVTKDPAAAIQDPANSEPFTNADQPGAYSGTLLVSATVP